MQNHIADRGNGSEKYVRRDAQSSDRTKSSQDRPSSKRSTNAPNSTGPSNSSARPHRPRSVSETSAADLKSARSKDGRRHQSGKDKTSSKTKKHLDKIDLLDVTGFASAGVFHHDGPFDACNPSRNKNSKKAPVLAFAKDSTAMTMAAGPPVQPVYFGDHLNAAESFSDYGGSGLKTRPDAGLRAASFDPTSLTDPIHGYESVGLGTSTFLEGAPASRSAMLARTTSDNSSKNENRPRATSDYASGASGLGRKKSVLQKIRGAYRDRSNEPIERVIPGESYSPPASPSKVKEQPSTYFLEVPESPDPRPTACPGAGTSSKLSPLYRPVENDGETAAGPSSLIKRVRSIRVSGKKRAE